MLAPVANRLKSVVNSVIAPTWCPECGSRFTEIEIGFREAGSYYQCTNAVCDLAGQKLRLPAPARAKTGKLRRLEPIIDI